MPKNQDCSLCGLPGAESARFVDGYPQWEHKACRLAVTLSDRQGEMARDTAWTYQNRTSKRDRLIERRKALQAAGIDTKGMTDAEINERSQEITNEPANA